MNGTCAICRFAVVFEKMAVCRRFPPHPMLMMGETMDPGDTMQGYWPRVGLDDVCGEFQQVSHGL